MRRSRPGARCLRRFLLRLRGGGRTTEARHDGIPALQRLGPADLEDAVLAERSDEVLQEVAVTAVRVLRQRVAARLAGGELPQFHGGATSFPVQCASERTCPILRTEWRTERAHAGVPDAPVAGP